MLMVLALSSGTRATAAPLTFDTSALAGNTFTLAFDLIDGDATPNSQVIINGFDFGTGGVVGSPTFDNGAAGSTTSGIVLSDASFLNTFLQDFTAGSVLRFEVTFAGGGAVPPDSFAFSILSNGLPVATSDPSGANLLLFAEIGAGTPTLTTFAVPEPATWMLSVFGVIAAARRHRGRKRREVCVQ